MPFTYQNYRSPFTDSIAARIANQGAIEANRAQQTGNAWAGAIQNIGQTVAAIPGQMEAQKRAGLQDQLLAGQVADMNQARQGQAAVDSMMRGDQLPAGDVGPRQQSYLDANGLFDIQKMTQEIGKSGLGHMAPELLKGAEAINDSILKHQQLEQQANQQHAIMLGDAAAGALKLADAGTPIPQAMDFVVQPFLATKRFKPEEYEQVKAQIASLPPEQQRAALTALMDQAAKLDKGETLAEGSQRVDRYGRVVASGAAKPVNVTEGGRLVDPATGRVIAEGTPKPPTAEQDKARYVDIQTRLSMRQPVTAMEQAWAKSYEKEKTLSVDASASAAATRLAKVQEMQVKLQQQAQNFSEGQAGRKELTDKVELPYLDAVEKAETLRSVVAAAKGGNQEAAALTPLLATLGVTTSEGVKRINMAEIATVQGAGSLFQKIKNKIGGVANGQPLSADLQNDIVKLADLLENSARQKYENGFKTITQRYGLKDETLRPKPEAPSEQGGGPIKVGGFTVVVK